MSTAQTTAQPRSLAEVRNSLRINWYRCPVEPATLRRLMQRSDLQGWLQAGGHLLLFLATGTLTYLLFAQRHLARLCASAHRARHRRRVLQGSRHP